jgi:hypothetical protein
MKITVKIVLGNDAMRTARDLQLALEKLGEKLVTNHGNMRDITRADGGNIRDANGNTVGTWELEDE